MTVVAKIKVMTITAVVIVAAIIIVVDIHFLKSIIMLQKLGTIA